MKKILTILMLTCSSAIISGQRNPVWLDAEEGIWKQNEFNVRNDLNWFD